MTTDTAQSLLDSIDGHLDHLAEQLSRGHSAELLAYLAFSSRFPTYSLTNQLLIYRAAPQARYVAGFHAWKAHGRSVKNGARAIRIVAPILKKEGETATVVGYRAACVFADADTEGAELPAPRTLFGDSGALAVLLAACPYPVTFAQVGGSARGLTDGRSITLDAPACGSPAQQAQTLAHEWAHCLLHFGPERLDRPTEELEADAVSFVVCAHLGLDAAPKVTDHLHGWGGTAQTLRASLGRVRQAAAVIIAQLGTPVEQAA